MIEVRDDSEDTVSVWDWRKDGDKESDFLVYRGPRIGLSQFLLGLDDESIMQVVFTSGMKGTIK